AFGEGDFGRSSEGGFLRRGGFRSVGSLGCSGTIFGVSGLGFKGGFEALWVLRRGSLSRAPSPGEPCPEPTIAPSYYTTSDAVIASESVFVVEISLVCKNGAQVRQRPLGVRMNLGRGLRSPSPPIPPQVSWSLEHRQAHSGTYEVKFFDEESYSALRKAQRNNEDVSRIRPLFTVSVEHRGAWSGPWVSTEVVAAAVGLLVYYLAFSTKSSIQA
ncbi:translocon-associated protein subunit delta, partial [Zonotrichia leucophrys gambelii]|uniref:translocon-associated protein subunit delta n=1 Tax=Zonotrichia leucophrys gambelii TaxID=257770 RepID=UPI0031407051